MAQILSSICKNDYDPQFLLETVDHNPWWLVLKFPILHVLLGSIVTADIVALYLMGSGSCTNKKILAISHWFSSCTPFTVSVAKED